MTSENRKLLLGFRTGCYCMPWGFTHQGINISLTNNNSLSVLLWNWLWCLVSWFIQADSCLDISHVRGLQCTCTSSCKTSPSTASYLILCVKMRERILIGSHKKLKESERKGNLEYIFGRMSIRTGDTDREEMIKGEMKEPWERLLQMHKAFIILNKYTENQMKIQVFTRGLHNRYSCINLYRKIITHFPLLISTPPPTLTADEYLQDDCLQLR